MDDQRTTDQRRALEEADRPEWWVRKDGVIGIKRFVPDRVMRRWEADAYKVKDSYVPACSRCPAIKLAKEADRGRV